MSRFHRVEKLPTWRVLALHAWRPPADPSVYGVIDVEVTNAQRYVDELRNRTGKRITLTHLVGRAVAQAIAERPEVNAIIRRGRLYVRESIDVFFQVAFEGGENLAGAKVDDADKKTVEQIADDLAARADRIRRKKDDPTQVSARQLVSLPPAITRLAMHLGEALTYDYDLNLSRFGIPYDAFGSCMVTNVAGFGLTVGHAPLFPPGRVPIVLTMGAVRDVAVAVDGEVVVRPVLTIGATFDHRLMDGFQAGRMARRFKEVLEHPQEEIE